MDLKKENGFTLIELLVVIAIIGLLASIVLVALNSSRQKARVAKRVADLAQIQKALELYFGDNNAYPNDGGSANWRGVCTSWTVSTANQTVWDTTLLKGLVPTYMSSIPVDPYTTQPNQNCYLYTSNGTDYKFIDYNITDMTAAQVNQYPTLKDPQRNGATSCGGVAIGTPDAAVGFAIFSPGGQCW